MMPLAPKVSGSNSGTTLTIVAQYVPPGMVRDMIRIQNTSATSNIQIGDGVNAVTGQGDFLLPGGIWTDQTDQYHQCTQNQVTILGSGADATFTAKEKLVPVDG